MGKTTYHTVEEYRITGDKHYKFSGAGTFSANNIDEARKECIKYLDGPFYRMQVRLWEGDKFLGKMYISLRGSYIWENGDFHSRYFGKHYTISYKTGAITPTEYYTPR